MKDIKKEGLEEIIYLDLNRVNLWCFERYKEAYTVDSMVRGIELGDDFPPVLVYRIDDWNYELTNTQVGENNLGGHYRAIAHYIANQKLKCMITSSKPEVQVKYLVKDIILYDNYYRYLFKKQFYRMK